MIKVLAKAAAANVLKEVEIIKTNDVLDETTDKEWRTAANIAIDSICSYIRNGPESKCGMIETGYGSEPSINPDDELNKRGMKMLKRFFESAPDKYKFYQMVSSYEDEKKTKKQMNGGKYTSPTAQPAMGGQISQDGGAVEAAGGNPVQNAADKAEEVAAAADVGAQTDAADAMSALTPPDVGVAAGAATAGAQTAAGAATAGADAMSALTPDVGGNAATEAMGALTNAAGAGGIDNILTGITVDRKISDITSSEITTAWSTNVAKHIGCSKELHERLLYLINVIFTATEEALIDDFKDIFEEIMKEQLTYSKQKINNERMRFHSKHLGYFTKLLNQTDEKLLKDTLNGYVKLLADYYEYLLVDEKMNLRTDGSANSIIRSFLDKVDEENKALLNKEIHKLSNQYIEFKNEFGVSEMEFVKIKTDKPLGFYDRIYNITVPRSFQRKKETNGGKGKKRKFTKKRYIKSKCNTTK